MRHINGAYAAILIGILFFFPTAHLASGDERKIIDTKTCGDNVKPIKITYWYNHGNGIAKTRNADAPDVISCINTGIKTGYSISNIHSFEFNSYGHLERGFTFEIKAKKSQ